jgi:iron complex outermembrane receptor protein
MTFKMKSMPQAILQVIASGALSAFVVYPAMAQQVVDDTPVQKVVVTGSYISRADKETESPVQVLTADDLKKSGYTSVSDVLRDITANGQGTISQSFNRAFAGGGSGVSLRGLTVGATLVLIDGHRMAPYPLSDDGQRPFVDISNIPFDSVERIEILKDGASSVYGSDAIAGVVNVILKKTFVGTTIAAEGGGSQKGGGATTHLSVTHGFGDLDSDGYTGYVSAEFRHSDAIRADQRSGDWTTTNWTPQGGYDGRPGVPNAFNANPNTLSPYLINPANGATAFYPGCSASLLASGGCAFTDHWSQLQPQTENINLLASFTKKLGSDWQVNVKASMFDSKDQVEIAPQNYPHGAYVGNTALGPGIIPHQVGVIPVFQVPANYPGNTTGGPANIYGVITDLGGRIDNVDSKSYRVAADLTGSWHNWDLSASLGMTRIVTSQTYSNYVDRTALYNAINSPTNPYLIGGGNSAAMIASISPTFGVQQTDELDYIELRGSHELMTLPGGPLTLGLGTTFIHKALDAPDADMFASGQINGNTAYAMGQQNDSAAFAEIYAPVLKSLEFDASARFDRYNTYGNSTTPKIGFKFTPIEQIAFRGTYSRGFRAPGPAENGTAGSTFGFNNVNDPLLCPGGPAAPGTNPKAGTAIAYCNFGPAYVQTTSPDLKPEKSRSATFGMILEPVKGWSSTIDYYNIKISNQIVTAASLAGYEPVFVRGAPTPQTLADGNGGTFIGTPAVGQILYATSGYVNAGSTQTSGVELDTSYKFKLGDYGSLRAEFQITHIISYELTNNGVSYELAGTHGPTVTSGDTGNPKNRAQFILGYDKGPLNVTTTFNWIDGYSVLDPSTGPGANDTCQNSLANSNNYFPAGTVPNHYCQVDSFLSTDLSASWKFNNGWTIHGSVLNMFNRQPPVDLQTYGGTTVGVPATQLPYNPSLHQIGAVGRFFNFGATYHF